jgi:predicted TIM-barrel fold metal-dependent hydrolase
MAEIPFVDTHVHFYDLRRKDMVYEWLQPDFVHPQLGDINAIKTLVYDAKSFRAEARFSNVSKVVHVQAALGAKDPVTETIWLDEMAGREGWPDAIIAAADLTDPGVEEILERHVEASSKVCGIRDFGQGDYLVNPDWHRGYAHLEKFDLLCDLDCTWENMGKARDVARQFPNTVMVLEHVGYPSSRTKEYFEDWQGGLRELASVENTRCKISGLGMYDHGWTVESFRPWVMACLEIFGVERCFFGSNWPVDRLFSSYDPVIAAYAEIISDLSTAEQEALFFANASSTYGLD